MKQQICTEIRRHVANGAGNRFPEGAEPFFDEPLIGFAAADDPLFQLYKEVIGGFHFTPAELCADGSDPWTPRTVISWVLPITEATRRSNRPETLQPSRAWSQTRSLGETFNVSLRRGLVAFLEAKGYRALAPQLHPLWKEYPDAPVGRASSWSERHAAYAAGLGTFSLNDGLITPRGIAHRCASVITDAVIEPSPRPYRNHLENCLFHREGTCGACIARCPVGALSRSGHDKAKCSVYVYNTLPGELSARYGVPQTGCGLCQTKVPCEAQIPRGKG